MGEGGGGETGVRGKSIIIIFLVILEILHFTKSTVGNLKKNSPHMILLSKEEVHIS